MANVKENVMSKATRTPSKLQWSVSCGIGVYAALADVRFDRLFHEIDAIVEAYTVGRPRAEAMFGPDVQYAGPSFGHISYGHINCLGAPLHFADGGEVGFHPCFDSLSDAIRAARRTIDWSAAGEMPFYMKLWREVCARFPQHAISFDSFRSQGPFTTAWALRGEGFFTDLYDDPAGCREYLDAVTDSIVDFRRFIDRFNDRAAPTYIAFTDDIAALLNPHQWDELVVPVLNRFYELQNAEYRWAHIENLTRQHLRRLDALSLDFFDPSVSPRITAADLRDACAFEFSWLLNPMQLREFTPDQSRAYVETAARDGASQLVCHVEPATLEARAVENIFTFIQTVKELSVQSEALAR